MKQSLDPNDIERRVYGAWNRRTEAAHALRPDNFELMKLDERLYGVLFRGVKTLVVYRVRNDGALKCLARPPKEFRLERPVK